MSQTIVIFLGLLVLAFFLPKFSTGRLMAASLFAVAITVSRLLDIQLPQGGRLHIDTAVIIASILLFPLSTTLVAIVVGVIASMLVKRADSGFSDVAYPLSLKILTAFLATYLFNLIGGEVGKIEPIYGLVSLLVLCAAYSLIDIGFDQLTISINRARPFTSAFFFAVRFLAPIYMSLSFLGVLLAIMYKGSGYWSLALFFLPLLVTRLSFKYFLDIRNVYRRTIEALTNAIEAQNPRRRGHGQRVARYAIDIAKELGIHGRELELIGYAALLHDIGMLGIDDDSLDHLLEQVSARNGEAPHALVGAEIIEQVDFLKDAADMVHKHHFPIDKASRPSDIPLGARIINVASHFDKLTRSDVPGERLTAYQAISKIKKDQGIVFDPKVVRALIHTLRRQGKLMEVVS
ncbi:MAG TPA: HD domain-containing phosphohydrolase [Anaerolineae bacterium]|jgi:putative nucleotidyltransferase with HDIG domain|nr:HD domain-containing phosphohydrolase [Anaerolineae bacterium]